MNNVNSESKAACKLSKKMSQKALNRVLRLPSDRTRTMLPIPLKNDPLQILRGSGGCFQIFNQTIDFKLLGKGKKHLVHIFVYLSFDLGI